MKKTLYISLVFSNVHCVLSQCNIFQVTGANQNASNLMFVKQCSIHRSRYMGEKNKLTTCCSSFDFSPIYIHTKNQFCHVNTLNLVRILWTGWNIVLFKCHTLTGLTKIIWPSLFFKIYLLNKLFFHFWTQALQLSGNNFFVSKFRNFWLKLFLHHKTVLTLAL